MERAKAGSKEFSVPKACSVEEIIADPEIEIILNFTVPKVNAKVALKILNAGKILIQRKASCGNQGR